MRFSEFGGFPKVGLCGLSLALLVGLASLSVEVGAQQSAQPNSRAQALPAAAALPQVSRAAIATVTVFPAQVKSGAVEDLWLSIGLQDSAMQSLFNLPSVYNLPILTLANLIAKVCPQVDLACLAGLSDAKLADMTRDADVDGAVLQEVMRNGSIYSVQLRLMAADGRVIAKTQAQAPLEGLQQASLLALTNLMEQGGFVADADNRRRMISQQSHLPKAWQTSSQGGWQMTRATALPGTAGQEAFTAWEKAVVQPIKIDPSYAEAWTNYGWYLLHYQQHKDSEQAFAKALQLKPDLIDALAGRGIALRSLRRSQDGQAELLRATRQNAAWPILWELLLQAQAGDPRAQLATVTRWSETLLQQRATHVVGHLHLAAHIAKVAGGEALANRLSAVVKTITLNRDKAFSPDPVAALRSYGSFLLERSRLPEATEVLERALEMDRAFYARDLERLSISTGNLASALKQLGRIEESLALREESTRLAERHYGPNHQFAAYALISMANDYSLSGRYADMLKLNERATKILRTVFKGAHPVIASTLLADAHVHSLFGQKDLALKETREAVEMFKRTLGEQEADTGSALHSLASLLIEAGDNKAAIEPLKQALAISRKTYGEEHIETAWPMVTIGELYDALGQHQDAIELLEKARKIFEANRGAKNALNVRVLTSLADAYENNKQIARAMSLYKQALTNAYVADLPAMQSGIMTSYSSLLDADSQRDAAILFAKEAVNRIQLMRRGLAELDKDTQRSFLKRQAFSYRHLAQMLVKSGRIPEAQQVLAMLKEDEYFEFVQRDSKDAATSTSATLSVQEAPWAARYKQITDQLGSIGRDLTVLRARQQKGELSAAEGVRATQLEADQDVASQAFDRFFSDMLASMRDLAARQASSTRIANAGGLQETLEILSERSGGPVVLLQYLLLEKSVSLILTTPTLRIAREYRGEQGTGGGNFTVAGLNQAIQAYRAVLTNPKANPLPHAQALYKMLWAPIAKDLEQAGAKTVMLSLDGAIRYLPIAALHDGQGYVMEKYRTVLFNDAASDKLKDANSANWKVWGLGLTKAYPGFSALSSVKGELEGIVGQGGMAGQILLDDAFNEQALRSGLSQRFPVVHIASHFKFTPGPMSESYLLMGDGTKLSLEAVRARMNFTGVDLVTLSACETGFGGGQDENGLEVDGLGAVVQRKGAKSVLASLWPVADASTAQLMKALYRLRDQEKLDKGESLRRAQLSLLTGASGALRVGGGMHQDSAHSDAKPSERGAAPEGLRTQDSANGQAGSGGKFVANPKAPFAHPYFWAPFILMGNWL